VQKPLTWQTDLLGAAALPGSRRHDQTVDKTRATDTSCVAHNPMIKARETGMGMHNTLRPETRNPYPDTTPRDRGGHEALYITGSSPLTSVQGHIL
jgi:hypothetical protein